MSAAAIYWGGLFLFTLYSLTSHTCLRGNNCLHGNNSALSTTKHVPKFEPGLRNQHRSIPENRVEQHQSITLNLSVSSHRNARKRITPQKCRHDLTYTHIRLRDFTLDDNLPDLQCQPYNDHISDPHKAYLGAHDTLPLELLCEILQQLDLCTLTDFRHVNRRAMWLVESFPQYKAIRKHAYNALRGIIYIEANRWITCEMLYEKLCTAECEECGDFGGYLYILTCKRVCFLCLSEDKRYLPLRYRHAIRKFGLNRPILGTLPSMKSIPGTYSPNQKKVRAQP
ncbi:hypothetical protein BGY98DRAFT_60892 [Russula aff. rugulosa BPL654]|nr:hypothetical protein BGY98DRAFT_60892 [Russula aff. rugulosa BPL654]